MDVQTDIGDVADLRIEEPEGRRQPRTVDFERGEHLAELPARKVIRQLHDQLVGIFDGGKKCSIHVHIFFSPMLIVRSAYCSVQYFDERRSGFRTLF
jgi:hypothetical protein